MKKLHLLIGVACLSVTSVAYAQTPAFTPPVLNAFGNEPTGNDGEFFTLNSAIDVTALGYAIPSSPVGNQVGLFDVTTNTLLASSLLTNTSSTSGLFVYNMITPVFLNSADEYAVVGLYTANNGAVGYTADSGVGASPAINFVGYAYDNNAALDIPTESYVPPIFGPNFSYISVESAPEPSSWALGLITLGSLFYLRRRATCAYRS